MIKKLFLILCALVLCSSSYAGNIKDIKKVLARKNAPCGTAIYSATTTADTNFTSSYDVDTSSWSGFKYTPAATQHVCAVDFYIRLKNGTWIDGESQIEDEIYLSIYTLTGTTLNAEIGRSASVLGKNFATTTWTSANAGLFEFSSAVALTGAVQYGFGLFRDSDSDPEDAPEINATHYFRLGYDSASDRDGIQGGVSGWRGSDGVQTTAGTGTLTDDLMIIVYGWND